MALWIIQQDRIFRPFFIEPIIEYIGKKSYFSTLYKPAFMKILPLLLSVLIILLFFSACQKEKSFESGSTPSAGSLQSDVGGECLPKTVAGVYEETTPLDPATNYIDVQVNVTQAGSYVIYTDTVNGTYFRATGTFTTDGANTVRLTGNGTPAGDGIFNYTVTYTTTACVVPVTVLPVGGAVDAILTLAGDPDECMNYTVAGDYITGVAMTPANTVVINVTVTTAGTYTISTALSNGMTFAGAGTLANLGPQTITLTATGTPVATGSTNFPITVGSSTCHFAVDVAAPASAFDYFPTTTGNNWSYQYDDVADDSLFLTSDGDTTLGGNSYKILIGTYDATAGFGDFGYYRKSGSNYHTYADMGTFFYLDAPVNIDYIFLKDNVVAGSTWQSSPVSGTSTITGTPVTFRIVFKIEQKDVNVTINGTVYNNVIVVSEKYDADFGTGFIDVTDQAGYYKTYYARGIGMIKQDYHWEDSNPDPPVDEELDIRRYQVL